MADDSWQPRRFGDLATLSRNTVTPDAIDDCVYIGLEHIGEGTLSLLGTGTSSDVTSTKNRFRAGQILFGKLRPYFRKVVRPNFDGVCSTDIWVIDPTSDTDPDFLFYLVASDSFVEPVVRASEGTKMPRAKWDYARDLIFDVPRHDEQRAIGAVLRAIDDKIGLNRRMAQTLEEMARALFKSWFVDFDPVRAKAEGRDPGLPKPLADLFPDSFQDSELGEIPKGWEVEDIYWCSEVIYGAPFKSALFNENRVGKPLIRIRDLRTHDPGVWTPEEHPRGYLVQPGDLVVGMDGEFRAHLWCGPSAWLNQRVCCFKPKARVPRAFVHYSIERLLGFFERSKAGTTVIHLGKRDIDTFRLLKPSGAVLEAFGGMVDPIDARIVGTEQESRTLASLRDTLLPKLISGELRIEDPERFLSAVE